MRLEGRKILITGGGSGIGLALAQALAPKNDVVIAGRDVQKLDRARASLPVLHTLRLDVTFEGETQAAVAWMTNRLGGLTYWSTPPASFAARHLNRRPTPQ